METRMRGSLCLSRDGEVMTFTVIVGAADHDAGVWRYREQAPEGESLTGNIML